MPNRRSHGSTRRWRNLRRLVAARIAITGAVPCPYCGELIGAGEPFDLDHRVPVVLGGSDRLDNLAPAHPRCNRAAHSNIWRHPPTPEPSREW